MTKSALRTFFSEQRKGLSSAAVAIQSQAIADHFFEIFMNESLVAIHCFLPIIEQNEVDTLLIISQLQIKFPETHIIVSRVVPNTNLLEHYLFTSETRLQKNRWGILEPTEGSQKITSIDTYLSERNSCVLVPLLGFDINGHRVGYGKGFYDRFLANIKTTKIGLSLFEPVEKIEDVNAQDIALDFCITPEKVWSFNRVASQPHTKSFLQPPIH